MCGSLERDRDSNADVVRAGAAVYVAGRLSSSSCSFWVLLSVWALGAFVDMELRLLLPWQLHTHERPLRQIYPPGIKINNLSAAHFAHLAYLTESLLWAKVLFWRDRWSCGDRPAQIFSFVTQLHLAVLLPILAKVLTSALGRGITDTSRRKRCCYRTLH